ncbi:MULTISPECIES: bacteriocin immunity protein [Rahnella]|uniref:bacteriocin immunity protein n=1 Tax=Rahnella TaxID=34037 RepID=UPI000BB16B44|nr:MULTISPECIES: bacteriocin immunity protein [Rahnella]PBI80259.1 colicin transporter [Rahnella victoriana]TBX36658.1 bacteriocin immunity protein [Rahnella victoriana]TDS95621.1 colicin immunity protein/pyocin immunity protein [Rahnella sp. BIGb0236]VTQ58497.1 Microcin-E8 immunity protein [Campylobacter jejuni]
MLLKERFEDYSEAEFIALVKDIFDVHGSESYQDSLLDNFSRVTEHPSGTDLIFYPEGDKIVTPESVIAEIKQWRVSAGKPLFKS